jgi:hypothetical protein
VSWIISLPIVRVVIVMNASEKIVYLSATRAKDNKEFYEKFWFKCIAAGTAVLFRSIPPLRRYIENSASWMLGMILAHERKGDYEKVLQLAHAGLEKCQHSTDMLGQWDWWQFICHAAHVAHHLNMCDERERLISISEHHGKTVEGYYPACALCYFSRWKYEQGHYEVAIKYAQQAEAEDEGYAEPDFLLGWYTLFVKDDDPVEYFRSAIRKDKRYLTRITHDPALKPYPRILSEVTELKVV